MTQTNSPENADINTNKNDQYTFQAIATVNSPYKEKFAIPRQPGLVSAAEGSISLLAAANNIDLVRGLEQFSHLWLIFVFHGTQEQGWQPLVRPPRLGGNKKLGVLATRSTFRPNPVGMSVVKLEKVEWVNQQVILHISGLDLLDQTPIIDIKPYVPYSDAVIDAQAGFAQTQPTTNLTVTFNQSSLLTIKKQQANSPKLKLFIEQVLSQDPRPAYKQNKQDEKRYGMRLHHFNIQWKMTSLQSVEVINIEVCNVSKNC
jgi:tRNA-Thr(GGU) m(6)t(6)A37 methyltransferase TsaA